MKDHCTEEISLINAFKKIILWYFLTLFLFHFDCKRLGLKNDCWYRTDPMSDIGPFPISWINDQGDQFKIQPWFPLPSNLINKGEEWIPEIQMHATVRVSNSNQL